MSSNARLVKGEHQKRLVKMFESLHGKHSRWQLWSDFITMSAISISNTVDKSNAENREESYMEIVHKYTASELDVFAEMLGAVVEGMEIYPDCDFLGELYMALELGNNKQGQFFTPYSICRVMATIGGDIKDRVNADGWISVNDPACGAGATLIAFANECRRQGVNYQNSVLFGAQDIDYITGLMCYIQLSLMGCAGYVVIGDTLTNPITMHDRKGLIPRHSENIWYTPMYFRDVWRWRRMWAQVDMLTSQTKSGNDAEYKPASVKTKTPKKTVSEPIRMNDNGQLTWL